MRTILLLMLAACVACTSLQSEKPMTDCTRTTLPPVEVDTTAELIAYYPSLGGGMDLVCGVMPATTDPQVAMCVEGAFTHALLDHFEHTNIDGDHVAAGVRHAGARCKDNSGAFIYYYVGEKPVWRFVRGNYDEALNVAAAHGGMGFGQALIVYDGQRIEPLWRKGQHFYRALCQRRGKLCVVDSRQRVDYATFVDELMRYGVSYALYLDMGSGWNHSWWRDARGTVHEIHPRIEKSRFCTNWVTFYR